MLAQEVEVFFAVAQALLRGAELVREELFGFGDGVGEHDVGLRDGEVCVSGVSVLGAFVALRRRRLDLGFLSCLNGWDRMGVGVFLRTPNQR